MTDSILWPALHEFRDLIRPDHTAGIAYEAVNRLFAKELASHVRNDDVVWIHDYHLMLLPQYLREELGDSVKNVKIGFFLHTPFPGSEIWKDVPLSADLLKGLLGADLIGFHTEEYVRNVEECCRNIL
jgi:trehalose 6-phosphate synthase